MKKAAVGLIVVGVVLVLAILGVSIASLIIASNNSSPGSTNSPQQTQPSVVLKDDPISNEFATDLLQRINTSVNPCDDFYEFACGNWPTHNVAPNFTSSWSQYDLVSQSVGDMIAKAIKVADITKASQGLSKAIQFYDTCLSDTLAETAKGKVLGALLFDGKAEEGTLNGFTDGHGKWPVIDSTFDDFYTAGKYSFESQMGYLKNKFGIDTFVYTYAMGYDYQSNLTIMWTTGSMLPLGLGIFMQDTYLSNTEAMTAYSTLQQNVANLLARDMGVKVPAKGFDQDDFKNMLQIEIDLANATYLDYQGQGQESLWNLDMLSKQIPNFKWTDFLSNLLPDQVWSDIKKGDAIINLDSTTYMTSVINILKKYRPRDIQNYMIWRLIKYSLPYMSSEYTQALADFNAVLYKKTNQVTPKDKLCLSYIRGNYEMPNLGYATAEAYIDSYFGDDIRKGAQIMVESVKEGLQDLMIESTWMDLDTKAAAMKKALFMDTFVGYPDWVKNKTAQAIYYEKLHVPAKVTFLSLNLNLRSWAVIKNFEPLGGIVDRLDFHGPPVVTDAWYTATSNSFSIPAGELVKPFYNHGYPDAANYGAAGAVVGHEMSHGFDSNGANYDAYGNINNWWSNSSTVHFDKSLQCLIKQFNGYCYPDIGCINGANTVTENTADLAGIKAAYKAYLIKNSEDKTDYRLAKAPQYTMDQIFFLNFASFWCGVSSETSLKMSLFGDVHAPGKYRVIGTLSNVPEFSKAFGCKKGDPMNPENKCSIW
uniref:Peptidase_M13 domain-containing protein n=1 Tax=Rhabditophanes sp. KR3021 TaxID=114890 RepID=A0AC35UEE8_9BILA